MENNIIFGPSGLGPVKNAVRMLEEYSELGFKACEIAFTYGPYIKNEEDMKEIKKAAKKLNIKLSIHAPYWINLNSKEKIKIESSKKRILKSCEIGEKLGAYLVVFHPGYYSEMSKEITYQNIKTQIIQIMEEIKKRNWKIKIAVETMGKVNVFGSIEEISRLVKETGCSFAIDFAHILAREKEIDFKKVKKLFPQKNWHCHFSGINYGEKGEKNHEITPESEIKKLLKNLPKDKNIIIINESPDPIGDSVKTLRSV
jgi:deoxyribonuclease IV